MASGEEDRGWGGRGGSSSIWSGNWERWRGEKSKLPLSGESVPTQSVPLTYLPYKKETDSRPDCSGSVKLLPGTPPTELGLSWPQPASPPGSSSQPPDQARGHHPTTSHKSQSISSLFPLFTAIWPLLSHNLGPSGLLKGRFLFWQPQFRLHPLPRTTAADPSLTLRAPQICIPTRYLVSPTHLWIHVCPLHFLLRYISKTLLTQFPTFHAELLYPVSTPQHLKVSPS